MSAEAQFLQALALANERRMAAARVKAAVRRGDITLAQALRSPDAGPVQIGALVACQRRWGAYRAGRLCAAVPVPGSKRVRDLTERQKAEIIRLAGEGVW